MHSSCREIRRSEGCCVPNANGGYDIKEMYVLEEWMRWDDEKGKCVLREDRDSEDDDGSEDGEVDSPKSSA